MHTSSLLTDIGLGIVFATVCSHVARLFRQPALLGYVLGGILLGPHLGLKMPELSPASSDRPF